MAGEARQRTEGDGEAHELLEQVRRASLGMASFQARLQSYEARYDRRETVSSDVRIHYRHPGSYRIEMLKSSKLMMSGAHVVYHAGEPTVKVKPGGMLKLLALTLPITDPRLLSLNQYRIDQVTGEAVMARLAEARYELSLAGQAMVGGERLTLIRAVSERNSLDANIACELLGCDAQGRFRLWQALGRQDLRLKDDLLYQLAVTELVPDAPVSQETFRL